MKHTHITLLTVMLLTCLPASAHDEDMALGLQVGARKELSCGIGLRAKAAMETHNWFGAMKRMGLGMEAEYHATRWLDISTGYRWMTNRQQEATGGTQLRYPHHWSQRHQFRGGVRFHYQHRRWGIALEESYRQRRTPAETIHRYSADGRDHPIRKNDFTEYIFCSRLSTGYECPHLPLRAYVAMDVRNDLAHRFETVQRRYTIGTDYHLRRHRADLGLRYSFWHHSHRDDLGGNHLAVEYLYHF